MNTASSTVYGWASLFVGGIVSFAIAKSYLNERRKVLLEQEEGNFIPENMETFEQRLEFYEKNTTKPRNK